MSKKRKYHLTKEEYELYRLSNYEWHILNTKISFYPKRKKTSKVLFFLKKYIILNNGKYQKSTQSMHKVFKNSCKISHSKFKDILNNLEDLGLIGVIRDGLKTKIYFIPDNPENNQNDKPKLKKNLKFKDSNLEESEDDIWSEFWNIVEKIKKNPVFLVLSAPGGSAFKNKHTVLVFSVKTFHDTAPPSVLGVLFVWNF